MKVLLLNRSYYPNVGGNETTLSYLSREIFFAGHEVTILTQQIRGDNVVRKEYATLIKYPRFKVCKCFLPLLPLITKRKITAWICANQQPLKADVVFSCDPMLALAYAKVFPEAKIIYNPAVVIKYYNKGIRKSSSLQGYIKEILRYCQLKIEASQQKQILKMAEKVIVFSENVKRQIKIGRLCPIDKVTVCYPGVADKFLMEPLKDNFNSKKTEFIFVGRLVAEKNLMMLIDAFAQLHDDQKHLTLVGDGDQRPILEKRVRELSIQDKVYFSGATNSPEKYYRKASFFVIPSKYESFGLVIIEALSMGLPVIGFASITGKTLTAVEELVQEGITGFVCEEFSVDALRRCMEKAQNILNEPEAYLAMRKNAAKFSKDNCSWKRLAEECMNS